MTFLPRIAAPIDSVDTRLSLVEGCEQEGKRPYPHADKVESNLLRSFRRWRSLRFGVDSLGEAEFRTRLETSEVGSALLEDPTVTRPQDHLDKLTAAFLTLGRASSDKFGRRSRVLSIFFGFFLAVAANVDSLNLLSTYLTSPELRQRTVAESSTLLDAATKPDVSATTGSGAAEGSPTEEPLSGIRALLAGMEAEELPSPLREKFSEMKTLTETASEAMREVRGTSDAVRRSIAGVSQSFPVGWTFYPNCYGYSVDPRCARAWFAGGKAHAQGKPEEAASSQGATAKNERTSGCGPCCVFEHDKAGFYRWLIGVLITGFLLGLGTPFWVSVTTGFMEARNWVRGGQNPARLAEVEKPPPAAPAKATPPPSAPRTNDLNTESAEPVG